LANKTYYWCQASILPGLHIVVQLAHRVSYDQHHWNHRFYYNYLLNLSGDFAVRKLKVEEKDWLANKKLAECRLSDEGVLTLGIYQADGGYVCFWLLLGPKGHKDKVRAKTFGFDRFFRGEN